MNLDEVLDKFGMFGRYHLQFMVISMFAYASNCMISATYIFAIEDTKYRSPVALRNCLHGQQVDEFFLLLHHEYLHYRAVPHLYQEFHASHVLCYAMLCAMIAPQTPLLMVYWLDMPTVLFSLASLCAGLVTFLVHDTADVALPDTVREAEHIRNKKNNKTVTIGIDNL